MKGDLLDRYNK